MIHLYLVLSLDTYSTSFYTKNRINKNLVKSSVEDYYHVYYLAISCNGTLI